MDFLSIQIFYSDSKLKITTDKTFLLVLYKPKHKEIKEEIKIENDDETFYPKQHIIILEWIIN